MKNIIILFALLLSSSMTLFANSNNDNKYQPQDQKGGRNAQITAMKMGFFAEKLEMTDEQTAKFWPIYMSNETSKRELQRKKRDVLKSMRDGKATLANVQETFKLDRERIELEEQTVKAYAKILSEKQIAQIFIAEEDFKAFLLHSFSGKGGEEGGRSIDRKSVV